MIVDIHNEIFTQLKNTLSDIKVLSHYPVSTPVFPCITFEEMSNDTNIDTIDTTGETHNDITFEINIFTESNTKVTDARELRNRVDAVMSGQYRMTRNFSGTIPNFLDTNVYRYTLRYDTTVDENRNLYRR